MRDVVVEAAGHLAECGSYDVRVVGPAQALAELAAGSTAGPDAWITDSVMWQEALRAEGTDASASRVIATSPVVLCAPKKFGARALAEGSLTADASWRSILSAEQTPLRVGDPLIDSASLATLIQAEEVIGSDQSWTSFLVAAAQQVIVGPPIDEVRGGSPMFVPTSEQQLWAADGGKDLQIVAPAEGAGMLSYRLLTMAQDQHNLPAVEAMEEVLRSDPGRELLLRNGLRPGDQGPSPGVDGIPAAFPQPAIASPGELEELTTDWNEFVLPVQMMVLIDVSGSMDTEVAPGGPTRMQITTMAAERALGALSGRSRLGLRWFATDRGPTGRDWVEAQPVETLSAAADGGTQRGALLASIKEVDDDFTTGDTGLYDSIADGYRDIIAQDDPRFRSSLVVLTDGANDDPGGGLSEEELLAELDNLRDDERPVRVILLGMGPDVESAPMQRIAEAIDGRYFPVEDPASIEDILVGSIAERST